VPESSTAVLAVPELHWPKKLHSVTKKEYVPRVNWLLVSRVGLVNWYDFSKLLAVVASPLAVLAETFTDLHDLPPDPVEEEASMKNCVQAVIET
jgi:hypothetical protein